MIVQDEQDTYAYNYRNAFECDEPKHSHILLLAFQCNHMLHLIEYITNNRQVCESNIHFQLQAYLLQHIWERSEILGDQGSSSSFDASSTS